MKTPEFSTQTTPASCYADGGMKNIKQTIAAALAAALTATHPALAAAVQNADDAKQGTWDFSLYQRYFAVEEGHIVARFFGKGTIDQATVGEVRGEDVHLTVTGQELMNALGFTAEEILSEHLASRADELSTMFGAHGGAVGGITRVTANLADLSVAFLVDPLNSGNDENQPLYPMTLRLEGDQDRLYSDGVLLAVRPDCRGIYSINRGNDFTPEGRALMRDICREFRERHERVLSA